MTMATCGRTSRVSWASSPAVVHPHLEHAEAGVARHPGERQRHADMVVVALDRAVRLAGRGAVERGVERLLGPGLAGRAGDPADPGGGAGAGGPAEGVEGGGGVGDPDVGAGDRLADDRPGGPAAKALSRKRWPSVASPFRATNRWPGSTSRESKATPPASKSPCADAADGRGDLLGGPERAHRRPCSRATRHHSEVSRHRVLPTRATEAGPPLFRPAPIAAKNRDCPSFHAAHSLATVTSSKGSTLSPTIWPCSWPLPARRMMSSGPASATAAAIASRRPRHLAGARRASQDVAPDRRRILAPRIVVGDDDEVGQPGRDRAHLGPLADVAVAAGAEDDDQPAPGVGPERLDRRLDRVGRMGIVDIDRSSGPGDHRPLQPAANPLHPRQAGESPREVAAGGERPARPRSGRWRPDRPRSAEARSGGSCPPPRR